MQPLVPSASSSLLDAFERQDGQFAGAFAVLRDAIAQHAFPAASIAVTHRGPLVVLKAFGHFTYGGQATSDEPKAGAPLLASFARGGIRGSRSLARVEFGDVFDLNHFTLPLE